MGGTDLADCGARELSSLFRSRRASPVEATEAVLRRIDAVEHRINAFVLIDRDGATAAARESERRYREGAALGPLDGVSATVKDMIDMAGFPTRRGSLVTSADPAAVDSPVVARLRRAGCVMIGKTTTTEFGWSGLSTSPLTGTTHNPLRHGLMSGGSSAGAAAAAAAGMGVLHIGTDGAGSVRLPAHFCGVAGFKPTFGTVPNVPMPNNDGLSHTGPITRRVEDAALMVRHMAGAHWGDPTSIRPDHLDRDGGFVAGRQLRIAYSPDLGYLRVDSEVREVVANALRRIEQDLGAVVEEIEAPLGRDGADIMAGYWSTVFKTHLERPAGQLERLDPAFVACLRAGADLSLAEYVALRGRRLAYAASINRFLSRYDLFVTPAASVVAFDSITVRPPHWPEHEHDWLAWAGFTYPFNLSHSPAISIPAGVTATGLPVGLQITASRLSDSFLLRASASIEALLIR